jgi:chromate transporter
MAHIALFRKTFVDTLRWISADVFLDLTALAHFLPGPASSQLGFAIGTHLQGWRGGLAAFAGFTAPSAIAMTGLGLGLASAEGEMFAALGHGLLLATGLIVSLALFQMTRTIVTAPMAAIAILAFLASAIADAALTGPALILGGGAAFLVISRPAMAPAPGLPGALRAGMPALCVLVATAITLSVLSVTTGLSPLAFADALFRSGALVVGGGHVVLPLLESEMAARQWIDPDRFLLGYGAVQFMPGPLFSFAAYLGAAADIGTAPIAGAALGLAALFAPGLLLIAAILPAWSRLRTWPAAAVFMQGAGSAVVGVLAAAVWDPILSDALRHPLDTALLLAAALAGTRTRLPMPAIALVLAAAGALRHLFVG